MPKPSRKKTPPTVGEYLRALIEKERGPRAVAAVAHELGMKRQQLDGILSGDRPTPKLETVQRILGVLGVRQCWGCKGSGKCPACGGKGEVDV